MNDGRIKLFVTQRTLACRRAMPALFAEGDYVPLVASGDGAEHVVAFARRLGEQEVIVAVPRLVAGLLGKDADAPIGAAVWGDGRLLVPDIEPGTRYRDVFTAAVLTADDDADGAGLALADLFGLCPVALLERLADDGE